MTPPICYDCYCHYTLYRLVNARPAVVQGQFNPQGGVAHNARLHITYNAGLQALQLGNFSTALRCFQVSTLPLRPFWTLIMRYPDIDSEAALLHCAASKTASLPLHEPWRAQGVHTNDSSFTQTMTLRYAL